MPLMDLQQLPTEGQQLPAEGAESGLSVTDCGSYPSDASLLLCE
jgi:hypothetical protein